MTILNTSHLKKYYGRDRFIFAFSAWGREYFPKNYKKLLALTAFYSLSYFIIENVGC